ncbi:hypothetical protein SAMN02745161_0642 [Halodesulfovibrio marinisediminis DSM 17456]|uniref:Uncharacterized protein n=1 Tax=Halodesulfovibrio marinisediminis DSM 17456 TaxID=1121457 RepID=A0A1N6E1P7_9BACT|nr:hypothetical protein SAMN02745161_0642 [Halodesulfovibrio marinisediminis DSM 17456]
MFCKILLFFLQNIMPAGGLVAGISNDTMCELPRFLYEKWADVLLVIWSTCSRNIQ